MLKVFENRLAIIGFLLVFALLFGGVPAYAHAHLSRATPAVNSTVATAPKEVVLRFTEALESSFSSIEVHDAQGANVETGKAQLDQNDHTQLRVALKPLPSGTYKVIWQVLSVDTHRTQGDFTFRIEH
jgi:copper resistance protein C